ncbi:hypothetical protein GCM10010182_04340 [Actinomadura cremea]|nr:hypothetical protein GCM10010182_04340 [Actinomadura cremea]
MLDVPRRARRVPAHPARAARPGRAVTRPASPSTGAAGRRTGASSRSFSTITIGVRVLWWAWVFQPLGALAFFDDQSGLLENRPSWHAPSLAVILGLGAVWPFAALLGLTWPAAAGRVPGVARGDAPARR